MTRLPCFALVAILLLTGCTTNSSKLLRVRSLANPIDPAISNSSNGDVVGLERTGAMSPVGALSILVVNGIGWTQQEGSEHFGDGLTKAINNAYSDKSSPFPTTGACPLSNLRNTRASPNSVPNGGLFIEHSGETRLFSTDDPKGRAYSTQIACLDKVVASATGGRPVFIYRLHWDDALWNAYQWPHLGYDDPFPRNDDGRPYSHPGYEDIDALRASENSRLKNALVTYGLSDATMYIGPVGHLIQEAVRSAICAVLSESSKQSSYFDDIDSALQRLAFRPSKSAQRASMPALGERDLCKPLTKRADVAFSIVTHSLGSRAVFDVLTGGMTAQLAENLNAASLQELEVFMLSNQIPLIGIGKLHLGGEEAQIDTRKRLHRKLRFVAVSEINDILTYELVPYFEHLYFLRCRGKDSNINYILPPEDCTESESLEYSQRLADFKSDSVARAKYIDELGFNIIDARVAFAPQLLAPFTPNFLDPLAAHSGYLTDKSVQKLIFCGTRNGEIRSSGEGCKAR